MKRLILCCALIGVLLGAVLLPVGVAMADEDCTVNPSGDGCPCHYNPDAAVCQDLGDVKAPQESNLVVIITNYVKLMLVGAGIFATAIIIYGGIKYMTSSGNKNNIASAKTIIIYAIAGLILAMSAYAVIEFVVGRFKK